MVVDLLPQALSSSASTLGLVTALSGQALMMTTSQGMHVQIMHLIFTIILINK